MAVVVTHNRLPLLRQAVQALLAAAPDELAALLVVDNAATDGTAAWLAAQPDPRLRVLRLPENRGGAGGFEAGMRLAIAEMDPDWLLVMDDDACPEPGALAAFHALDLRGWDAVAGAVHLPDGRPCDTNRPTLNPFVQPRVLLRALMGRGREAFHLGPEAYGATTLRPVDGASFVGLFLSRQVFADRGFPDGGLFLYAEDAMYTLAMTRAGLRLAFAPTLKFRHDHTTTGTDDPRMRPLWKVYYYHRNLTLLYRQLAGPWLFWPVMAVYGPRWALKMRHHGGERRRFLRLLGMALRDGIAGRTRRPHAEVMACARDRS